MPDKYGAGCLIPMEVTGQAIRDSMGNKPNQWINQAWVSTVEAQKGAELQGILSITACPPILDSVKCLWPMYGPDPP